MPPPLLRALNRILGLCTKIYMVVLAAGIATILALTLLGIFISSAGTPGVQAVIHSDDFFPWPVAATFFLMEQIPAFVVIGLIGTGLRRLLRYLLLARSDRVTAKVLAVHQTGGSLSGRSVIVLKARIGRSGERSTVRIRTPPLLASIPRVGDQIRLVVSQADSSYVVYAGLAREAADSAARLRSY